MASGVVASTTTGWSGGTLTAAVAATDTILYVDEVVDFDDDENNDNRWLVIADSSTPLEYVDVDEDAGTVTLAAAVGTAYEADLPVNVWDATVANGGARVVEYTARVERDDDEDSVPVTITIPPGQAPTAGVDLLIGARVAFDYNDDDVLELVHVIGREASIDPDYVLTPTAAFHRSVDTAPITSTIWTPLVGWGTPDQFEDMGQIDGANGWVYVTRAGRYLVTSVQNWQNNTVGARRARLEKRAVAGSTSIVSPEFRTAPDASSGDASPTLVHPIYLAAGEAIRVQVWQSSGGGLAVTGDAGGLRTTWHITYLGVS